MSSTTKTRLLKLKDYVKQNGILIGNTAAAYILAIIELILIFTI